MSLILYYSNYCDYSKKILQLIANDSFKNEIHFICIDKRVKESDGKTYIILQNNKKIVMPPTITKVPALLMLNDNYNIIYGNDITNYLNQCKAKNVPTSTLNNMEPMAFSLGGGNFGIASDNYSFIDSSADELSAKGDGGMKQMHNYVSLNQADQINTPSEDFDTRHSGNGEISLEKLQEIRNSEMNNIQYNTKV